MAIETTAAGTTITGEHIDVYRILALKGMLKLEARGMKGRNSAGVKQAVRDICGSTKKQAVPLLREYEVWIAENLYPN